MYGRRRQRGQMSKEVGKGWKRYAEVDCGDPRFPHVFTQWVYICMARLHYPGLRVYTTSLVLFSSRVITRHPRPHLTFQYKPPVWALLHVLPDSRRFEGLAQSRPRAHCPSEMLMSSHSQIFRLRVGHPGLGFGFRLFHRFDH